MTSIKCSLYKVIRIIDLFLKRRGKKFLQTLEKVKDFYSRLSEEAMMHLKMPQTAEDDWFWSKSVSTAVTSLLIYQFD